MKSIYIIFLFVSTVLSVANSNAQSGWIRQNHLPPVVSLSDVCFTDANTGTAVGSDWDKATILRTTDGGKNWGGRYGGIEVFNAVSFTDANTGTVVGAGGTILRTTTGGVTSVREEHRIEVPRDYSLSQNYPNPFNPSTTIRYGLPNRSHATLTVFNTLGQKVALLQNGEKEAGYHEVKFDGSGLSSGVYFYRIQEGDFVQTKTLVLLK